jgi:hypothetical protein
MRNRTILALGLAVLGVTAAQAQGLTALTSFAGDGWLAPGENNSADWLGTASNERSISYNRATNSLYVATRSSAGTGIKIVDGTTGQLKSTAGNGSGNLFAPAGGFTGGLFVINAITVADDGQIFVGNLGTSANTYKLYRWSSENDSAPTSFTFTHSGRIGDSIDVFGEGVNTRLVAGGSGSNGFMSISTANGTTYTGSFVTAPGPDFRLGVTFGADANSLFGKQTGASAAAAPLRTLGITGGTTWASSTVLTSGGEAAMDYINIGGVGYLATLDMNSSIVRVYDVTSSVNPTLISSLTTTSGTLAANGNAAGSVKWGNVTGTSATLYAMSSNQGIQAMTFESVPEPMTMTLLAAGLAGIAARRRRKS